MAGIRGQTRILGWADVSLLRGFRNLTSGARILDPRILQYFRKMDFGTKRLWVTLFSIKKMVYKQKIIKQLHNYKFQLFSFILVCLTVNMLSLIKSVREK